jgi:pyruvate-formate lyase-activating enzyme
LHQARTASCHRTAWSDFSSATFDSFHNTPIKIQDREAMLAGHWPEHSCAYCKNIEEAGGTSDRHIHMDHPNRIPIELEADPVATQVTPTVLEVYFNNTCNLGCLYCIPELSSKINQENIKFGKFDSQGVVLESVTIHNQHSEIVEKFWQWMQTNSQGLTRLHVLGGEPFYQSEFDRCLEYFDSVAHPALELNIVTNLMIDPAKLSNYIKKFKELLSKKHLKRIDITCSIDCVGPEQEFVRWGMNVDRWLHNFDLLRQHKWLTLNINQTISVLTIKTMPTLMNWLAAWRQSRHIGHSFSVVAPQPSYMDPAILGAGVFDSEFESVLSQMPDDINKQYMAGIFKAIQNSNKNPVEMLKLKTFLNEKDQRRGTDWKQVFPWLAKELEHVV